MKKLVLVFAAMFCMAIAGSFTSCNRSANLGQGTQAGQDTTVVDSDSVHVDSLATDSVTTDTIAEAHK